MMAKLNFFAYVVGLILLQFGVLNAQALSLNGSSVKVIYGNDDRKDLFEVSNTNFKTWADSTVALVD